GYVVPVRAVLAIDLDGVEVRVQELGDLEVLVGLLLHDVAPVAGGVADAEQHRPPLAPRGREGLVAPRAPVDGVVRVLEEVRARLEDQAVRVARRAGRAEVMRAGRGLGGALPRRPCEAARERRLERAGAGQRP